MVAKLMKNVDKMPAVLSYFSFSGFFFTIIVIFATSIKKT